MTTNDDYPIDVEEFLSAEELEILGKINTKIYEHAVKTHANSKYDHLDDTEEIDFADNHPDVIHKQHITDCPHEIRITLDMNVNSVDEKGNLKEVKELITKYFHIPIPSHTNYMDIVLSFLKTFESKLFDTCTTTIKPSFKHEQPQTE